MVTLGSVSERLTSSTKISEHDVLDFEDLDDFDFPEIDGLKLVQGSQPNMGLQPTSTASTSKKSTA